MGRTKHRKKHAEKVKQRRDKQIGEKRNLSNKLMELVRQMKQPKKDE